MLVLQREVNRAGYNIISPSHSVSDNYDYPMEII